MRALSASPLAFLRSPLTASKQQPLTASKHQPLVPSKRSPKASARRGTLVVTSLLVSASTASAAPRVVAVHTDTGEARACLPLAGGGMLVGTGGGLVRIDAAGQVSGVWTAIDGLPGTRIESIVQLGADVWIGTDAGAARVTLGAGGDLAVARAYPTRPVRHVAAGPDGATYLATWDGGVRKVAGARTTLVPFKGAKLSGARARVAGLAVAGGALYAGTAAGLYRLERGALVAVSLDGLDAAQPVAALRGDGDRLWIATTEGLHVRDPDGTVRHFGGGDLRAVAALGDEIVVAGVADGLRRIDRGRLARFPGAPRELAVAQTLGVAGDAVCAGGLAGAWLRPSADAAWLRAENRAGPPSNDISALAADGDRLWVGTFDRGLAVRDAGAWRAIAHPELDARINAILVEPRAGATSRVWVATANGLSTIDGSDVTRLSRRDGLPGRGVLALARLRDGRILAGTSYGAVIVGAGRPERLGPKSDTIGAVWAVAEASDGTIWLGGTEGVFRGAPGASEWTRYSLATGHLRDDWVTALVARDRTLWIGTYKGGVTRLDVSADGALTTTQLGDGWINPNGLSLDGDRLLAATMDGILTGDGATPTWAPIEVALGKDATAIVRTGATHWVSTRRGLAELR
jgi:ligand-binding sensor domain-containing protein